MISIVVCHHNPSFLDQLKRNISNTIGVPYEMVIIDNRTNEYNIFQAYNLGIKQSKFDLICFAHEDIIFHTKEWGQKVIEHFKNPKVGIIGVAGSHYLPKLPGGHWSSGIFSKNVLHTIDGKTQHEYFRYTNNSEVSVKAVLVDGLWICTTKKLMRNIRFDEVAYSGFHCYDADICLQTLKLNYDVRIVFNVDIEHFSLGVRNTSWLKNIFLFFNKWKHELPKTVIKLSELKISEANYHNAKELIEQIRLNNFGRLGLLTVWFYYIQLNPLTNKRNIRYFLLLIKKTFN